MALAQFLGPEGWLAATRRWNVKFSTIKSNDVHNWRTY